MSVMYVRDKDGNFVPIQTIRGNTGPTGSPGKTPVKGEDYFTTADQESMLTTLKTKAEEYIDEQLGTTAEEIDTLIGGDA